MTHLPQLAAMADTQFSVEKGEEGRPHVYAGAACSTASSGGRSWPGSPAAARLTETMLAGAEELLAGAEEFRKSL